jgi:hypothetical protein
MRKLSDFFSTLELGGIGMDYTGYALYGYRSYSMIQDKKPSTFWTFPIIKKKSLTELEYEIHLLRTAMENIAITEQSLTSEAVITISSLLDEKINEYMLVLKKSRS